VLTHRDVKLTLVMVETVTSHMQSQCAADGVQADRSGRFDPPMYRYCSQDVFSVAINYCVTMLYHLSILPEDGRRQHITVFYVLNICCLLVINMFYAYQLRGKCTVLSSGCLFFYI